MILDQFMRDLKRPVVTEVSGLWLLRPLAVIHYLIFAFSHCLNGPSNASMVCRYCGSQSRFITSCFRIVPPVSQCNAIDHEEVYVRFSCMTLGNNGAIQKTNLQWLWGRLLPFFSLKTKAIETKQRFCNCSSQLWAPYRLMSIKQRLSALHLDVTI